MSDTPECDLLEETTLNPADWMDLARRLERERNEMLAALEELYNAPWSNLCGRAQEVIEAAISKAKGEA